MTVPPSRDEEIRLIWKENQWLYMVVGFIAGLLFCLLTQLSILNLPELVRDLLPEAAGILVTITVIDQLNRRRDTRNANQQLKQRLIIQMRSKDNAIALQGLEELRAHGWVEDGSLQWARLYRANLQEANLQDANLQEANLQDANLQRAKLNMANLQRADLWEANLNGAILWAAEAAGTDLFRTKFDENTILPDGTHWTPDTDMTRFTQPDNADESV